MAFNTILVDLNNDERDEQRLSIAAMLATPGESHVVGLFVIAPFFYPPMGPFTPSSMDLLAEIEKSYLEDTNALVESLRERSETWAKSAGLAFEWRAPKGMPVTVLPVHARHADLAVMGQPDPSRTDPARPRELPTDVVLDSGRPVLIVPYAGTFETVGQRVMVAWNATRESARAVYDAMPILQAANEVHVVSIDPPDESRIAGFDISAQLARHGVKTITKRIVSSDISVGDVILSEAADLSADLIVMGAYGHSRFREMVLGGASRLIMSSMTVPILMSH